MLATPVRIGSITVRNRLYRAPVLEGAGRVADPAKEYLKHFRRNAEAGVGLIVQGHTTVTPEGTTSPGMTHVDGPGDLLRLRPLTDAVHRAGAAIVVQLGHGGLYALEHWNRKYVAKRRSPPIAPSEPPWWVRPLSTGVRVPSTDEVRALVDRFAEVAVWAREAGYDGVQIAACNAKLGHQFLSRTYNRRTDRYGGDLAGRTRFLVEVREAIARRAPGFPVLLKFTAIEAGRPGGGITLDEGVEIARIAEQSGYDALTPAIVSAFPDASLCRGDFPAETFANGRLVRDLREAVGPWGARGIEASMRMGAWRWPLEPVWNRRAFAAVKAAVDIPVLAVGGIRTAAEATAILADGQADLVGFGRPFYAEPELPATLLSDARAVARCGSCNRCLVPQMLGMPGVCYNPAARAPAA